VKLESPDVAVSVAVGKCFPLATASRMTGVFASTVKDL
jgi:hypothetical protein